MPHLKTGANPQELFLLAVNHQQRGQFQEAIAIYDHIIAIKPDFVEAHNNRGNALYMLGRYQEALASYDRALAFKPDHIKAHNNRGNALCQMGRYEEALASANRAITLKPDYIQAHNNRGNALRTIGRLEEAEVSYRKAIELKPDYADALANLALLLISHWEYAEAEALLRKSLMLSPAHPGAVTTLGALLEKTGRAAEAAPLFETVRDWGRLAGNLRMWAAWSNLAKVDAAFIDDLRDGRGHPPPTWPLLNIPALTPRLQRQAALNFANNEYGWALRQPPLISSVAQNGLLRIGYLSADYYDHAVMRCLVGVLEAHDPGKVEVHLLSIRPARASDDYTQRIAAMPVAFHDLSSASAAEGAKRIAEIAPHLLIDLNGYTEHTRLDITALRPAPVIVSWLGYAGTLGHERLADYIIGDPVVTPPGHAGDFSETLTLMPHSYQPNDRWSPLDPAPSRAAAGLPETGFVFCSFNQYIKINPDTFDLWCRLLAAIPGSVLWLVAGQEQAMTNLKREAEKRGIAGKRLVFAQREPPAKHLARLQLADLSLDTFPYNSHGTASDVLRAGVPLVTRIGETFASRVAASLLTTHGFPELIAADDESYLNLALSLARDPVKLADLRQRLQEARQGSLLFDSERFARDLERLYAAIWDHHLAGNDRTPIILPSVIEQDLRKDEPWRKDTTTMGKSADKGSGCRDSMGNMPHPKTGADPLELFLLAANYHQRGQLAEAIAAYDHAIALKPDLAEVHNDRGNALYQLGRYEEALASYDRAIAFKPDLAEAHNNRGNLLYQLGRYEEALASVDRAIAFKPNYAEAYNNRGNLLYQLGRYEEALASVDRAIAFKPDYAEAYNNHGYLLCQMGRLQEAEVFYRKAIELEPNHAHALKNLGTMLEQTGRAVEAAPLFETIENWGRLAGNLRMWAAWNNLAKVDAAFIDDLQCGRGHAVSPWLLLNIPVLTPQLQRQTALDFANEAYCKELQQPPLVSSVVQNGPLRVGYLSSDYYDHATMHLLAGVLEAHDPGKVEVHLLSTRLIQSNDVYAQRIAAMPAAFHDLSSASDVEAAQRIAEIAPHLLIDLKGYTTDARPGITARRSAPVIVSWLGYPGTLGHERLADYIIGDPVVTPPGHAGDFSETLALMPHSYQPNDRWFPLDPAPNRAAVGLPETGFVFCSFNQYIKINPDTFDLWCRLLAAIPGSVLWMLAGHKQAMVGGHEQAMVNLKQEAEKRGIAGDRLIFAQYEPRKKHLARLQLADLSLDTFPCNSHTTASDVLRAGVPLVTRIGETFASRVAASLLTTHGFPELITTDNRSYFELALSLARDPVKLADLRQRLREARQTSLLFDSKRFARDLERLYAAIWAHHKSGNDRTPIILPSE